MKTTTSMIPFSCSHHTLLGSPKPLVLPVSSLSKIPPFLAVPFKTSSSTISPAKTSASGDYHLISTNELEDGSLVFRFGDESELAKFVEMEKAKLSRKVAEQERTDEEIASTLEENDTNAEEIDGKEASNSEEVMEGRVVDVNSTDSSKECSSEMISYRILAPGSISEVETDSSDDGLLTSTALAVDSRLEMVSSQEILTEDIEEDSTAPGSVADVETDSTEGGGESSDDGSPSSTALAMDSMLEMLSSQEILTEDKKEDSTAPGSVSEVETDSAKEGGESSDDGSPSSTALAMDSMLEILSSQEILTEDTEEDSTAPGSISEVGTGSVEEGESSDDGLLTSTALAMDSSLEVISSEEILTQEDTEEVFIPSDDIEAADSLSSIASTDKKDIEVAELAVGNEDLSVDTEADPLIVHNGDEGSSTLQSQPEIATLEAEKDIIQEESSNKDVDVPIQVNETNTLELLGDNDPSDAKEVTVEDTAQCSSDEDVSGLESAETQTIGDTMVREEISTTGLTLSSGASSLPHPSKILRASDSINNHFQALTGKEDAYFVDANWLGIADGTGEWSLEGTNARVFASELIENCTRIVSDGQNIGICDPVEVLNKAVVVTQSPGSSAALVAHFDGQVFHVANIGDSGFVIIRDGYIIKRSAPMHHEFHFPLQIGNGDDPSEIVERYKIDVDEGDVIITASDGLFDNLYEQEVASIVSKLVQSNSKPEEIADLLAARAQDVGQSKSVRSPFADAAQAAGYVGYSGGKLDDVTVIVSIVQSRPTIISTQ
ncbi:hypothetical protein Tsubulata_025220 [Turnera subulata]|uniref:Protein phosphatase n=1 Tax=Turnera subulata TaxID=218843 RepID=A0A9Q0F4R2_9ROSI|nr:hypothetical protein Tsubulata_025220 [Turnera subulata]